jgi:hypothetical protein
MILGIPSATFVAVHVALSLVGIVAGLAAIIAMARAKFSTAWTVAFLGATVLTSATGFPIPPFGLDPPRILGILSLCVLAVAVVALYGLKLAGAWRWVYIVSATLALYFNCFVAVVQAFQKVPALRAFAPTQTEPPFAAVQLTLVVAFLVLGFLAVRRFRGTPSGLVW